VARSVCLQWNQLISADSLTEVANLNLKIDDSRTFKYFSNRKWKPSLIAPWEKLTIFMLNPYSTKGNNKPSSIFHWGSSSPFKRCFPLIRKLIVVEDGTGSCSVLDLVHSMACHMPSLTQISIREVNWSRNLVTPQYISFHSGLHTFRKSWRKGTATLTKINAVNISLFSRYSTAAYLNMFLLVQAPLVSLDIDFSKNYGLPMDTMVLNDMYEIVANLIVSCKTTLQQLRIKWDYRVEEDQDLIHAAQDGDPFVEFMVMVATRIEHFKELALRVLILNFPTIGFFSSLTFEVLIPFLKSQEGTLERVHLSRCKWDMALHRFHSRFSEKTQEIIEYSIYMLDLHEVDPLQQYNNGLQMLKMVRGIDFHSVCTEVFTFQSINARRRISRRTGRAKWAKHPAMTVFKLLNSGTNVLFQGVNLKEILLGFRNLQELELIDGGGEGHQFSNKEFNAIFLRLKKLQSLKMSNLGKLTDSGITGCPEEDVRRMRDVGVYTPQMDRCYEVPVAQAKCNISSRFY
jgi:hypothetical protein